MILENKVVLITGAAGVLGETLVRHSIAAGGHVALVDRSVGRLEGFFGDIQDALLVSGIELSDPDSVQKMADAVIERFGRIDVLFNAAGGWRGGQPVHETPPDLWDTVMDMNAKSVFLVSRAVIPHMLKQGSGKIVSIAAKSGLMGTADGGAQSASKAAVIRLTEAMSAELKNQGINVNCVVPSIIDTPANRESFTKADPGKWVTPDQMASVMLFLTSETASVIHGAAIPVYGRA